MGKLTVLAVKKANAGVHVDGIGLLLRVKPGGARSWVLRVQHGKRRRDIGLGSIDDLTLAEAREKAAHLRKVARAGGDPIAERDKGKGRARTFAEAVNLAHEELGKGWGEKTAAQFKASLDLHAVPRLGTRQVDQVGTADVIAVLEPIWTDKPEIARKVRHRILQVLAFAKARGWRADAPPTADELRRGLAKQRRSVGFSAMPYADVPGFMAGELAKDATAARLALLFTILTAARSGEVRQARWSQVDRAARLWVRPAEIMKGRKAHTVVLSEAALAILDAAELLGGVDLVFPSPVAARPLSDAALGKMMRLAGRDETVHGFRSSFRDWAAERMPHLPASAAEAALAHRLGDATVEAYLRSDFRALRVQLMDAWGLFAARDLAAESASHDT